MPDSQIGDYLTIAPLQLNGAFDYRLFRRKLRELSDLDGEVSKVRAIVEDVRTAAIFEPESETEANAARIVANDAKDSVATFIRDVINQGVLTASSAYWFGMADAISCVSRLSLMGEDAYLDDGMGFSDLATAVAILFDASARAADPTLRGNAIPPRDYRMQTARIASVYIDIIVGRAPFWVFYCNVMAAVASVAERRDYASDATAYATLRTNDLLGRVGDEAGCSTDDVLVVTFSRLVDAQRRQAETFSHRVGDADTLTSFRYDIVAIAKDAIKQALDHLSKVDNDAIAVGYMSVMSTSPTYYVATTTDEYDDLFCQSLGELASQPSS